MDFMKVPLLFMFLKVFKKLKEKQCFVTHKPYMKLKFSVHNYLFCWNPATIISPLCLSLLLCCKGRVEELWQRPYGPRSQKHLLFGPLQKRFSNFWSSPSRAYDLGGKMLFFSPLVHHWMPSKWYILNKNVLKLLSNYKISQSKKSLILCYLQFKMLSKIKQQSSKNIS